MNQTDPFAKKNLTGRLVFLAVAVLVLGFSAWMGWSLIWPGLMLLSAGIYAVAALVNRRR